MLLKKAVVSNNGKLTTTMANQLYSGSSKGRDVVQSLQFQGFLEYEAPGVFKVVKLPDELKRDIQHELEA